jgi:hypothetical protein
MSDTRDFIRLKLILSIVCAYHFLVFIYTEQIISLIIGLVFVFMYFNIIKYETAHQTVTVTAEESPDTV